MAEGPGTHTNDVGRGHAGATSGDVACRVLIVDDEPDICTLLRMVLEGDGFTVVGTAGNAERAVTLWREHRPDVVLLDHQLPGVSGSDVARTILAEAPEQRIVFVTANPERVRDEAARLGLPVIGKGQLTDVPRSLRVLLASG